MPGCDLSIIIVSFNTRDYLKDCLESIYQSIGIENYEVIVVDNCSADGSPEMVAATFPQVMLITPGANLGFARANNLGAKKAQGRYLLFLNPDTVVSRDTFLNMINFMDKKPSAGAANCLVLNGDGSIQLLANRKSPSFLVLLLESLGLNRRFPNNPVNRSYVMADWDRKDSRQVEVISGAFFFVRSGLYKDLGGFNDKFFLYVEDFELSQRVILAGYEIWFNPSTSIIHFGGKSSSNFSCISTVKGIDAIFKYLYYYKSRLLANFYKSFMLISFTVKFALAYLSNIFSDNSYHYNEANKYLMISYNLFRGL